MNIKVAIEQLKGVKDGALPSLEAVNTILIYFERDNQIINEISLLVKEYEADHWTDIDSSQAKMTFGVHK